MKQLTNIVFLTLLIFLVSTAKGQNTELDTVFVKKSVGIGEFKIDTLFIPGGRSTIQVLAGTVFLPNSDKMIGLLNNGISPISLEIIKECDKTSHPKTFNDYPKFLSTVRIGDTLTIDVSVVANCCHNFLGEAEVIGNDTLNLVYTSYGGFCSCDCIFILRYKFDTSMEEEYLKLKYVKINSSKAVEQISNSKKLYTHSIRNSMDLWDVKSTDGWIIEAENGKHIRYCMGKLCNGEIIDTFGNGNIKHKANYVDGKPDGAVRDYYINGQIRSYGECKLGKRIGKWIFYFENGNIEEERNYEANLMEANKTIRYYITGGVENIFEYNQKGIVLHEYDFSENGDTMYAYYPSNIDSSTYSFYERHNNGLMKEIGFIKHIESEGYIRVGLWQWFDEMGNLIEEKNYND